MPELSVAKDIFSGKEVQKGVFLDTKRMQLETEKILEKLGVSISRERRLKI